MKKTGIYLFVAAMILTAFFVWKSSAHQKAHRAARLEDGEKHLPADTSLRAKLETAARHANVPIAFLGKVVDEDGAPLGGVIVNYKVNISTARLPFSPSKYDRDYVMSGSNGVFEINGKTGTNLGIGPLQKAGYRDALGGNKKAFGFFGTPEPHDAKKQIVFAMVKNEIPGATPVRHQRLRFRWNNGEVRIPLQDGLGDFVLTPYREMPPGRSAPDRRDPFPWQLTVAMEGAQLAPMPDDDILNKLAPESGYLQMIEFNYPVVHPKWSSRINNKRIALKTSDGKYGIIKLNIYVDRDDFDVNGGLSVGLNPSGKRNLD